MEREASNTGILKRYRYLIPALMAIASLGSAVLRFFRRLEPLLGGAGSAGVVHASGLRLPSRRPDCHWTGWFVQGCGSVGKIGTGLVEAHIREWRLKNDQDF